MTLSTKHCLQTTAFSLKSELDAFVKAYQLTWVTKSTTGASNATDRHVGVLLLSKEATGSLCCRTQKTIVKNKHKWEQKVANIPTQGSYLSLGL